MELVKVNLYAYAYYSGVEYEENIWIKKSSYEKIKECFPTEVYIADIDGKYSETEGKVTVKESFKSDKEYAIEGKLECDGESLKWELESVYENNNLDYEFEQEESYTSGTSFLDEENPIKENYNKNRRIQRGLFKSNSGLLINSDVNGSFQIMKKAFPNAISRYGIEGVLTPIVINVA